MQQEILAVAPLPSQTLEHFIPGHNLEMLFSLFRFRGTHRVDLPIYLFGEAQSGKTHLLRAALQGNQRALYIDARLTPDLTAFAVDQVQYIAIDNIDALSPHGSLRLFALLHYYSQQKKHKILLSGPCVPAQLTCRHDLRTRISASLCYKIQTLTDKEKKDYLMLLARARGLSLREEVARFILNHVEKDMSSLRYWLDQIDRVSLREKKNITESFVRHVLEKEHITI